MSKPVIKRGPAYLRVLSFLEEAAHDDSEYTSIHNASEMLARHFENLTPENDQEAEAIDKLLSAIANYAEVRGRAAK